MREEGYDYRPSRGLHRLHCVREDLSKKVLHARAGLGIREDAHGLPQDSNASCGRCQ